MKIVLKNELETSDFGQQLANLVQIPSCIALVGEMGSGKTVLTRNFIKAIADQDDVASPTFNIVNEYNFDGKKIYHFDFYRLESENELYNVGFDEYITNKKAITIIEWADKFPEILPKEKIVIQFEKQNDLRILQITSSQKNSEAFYSKLKELAYYTDL